MKHTKSSKNLIRFMMLAFAVVFMTAGAAFAGVGGSDVPTVPGHVDLGETGIPFSFTITNQSTNPNDVNNVQALDGFIFFTTTCGFSGSPALSCPVGAQEAPNTITISPLTATGQAGTACAGITFTVSQTANPNEYLFTPSAPVILGPSSIGGLAATCKVNFTVDVNSLPVHDSSGSAGLQTSQLARVGSASGDGGLQDTLTLETGSAAGSSTVNVFVHCLHVVKQCTNASCTNGNIGVSVTATNCGTEGLINLSVIDNQAGALACNSTTLAAGASTTCSGSYTSVPGTYTDTITASAASALSQDQILPDATSVLAATCTIPSPAVVSATKICNDNVACGDTSASFAVTICNDGDVAWSGTWSDANCGIANQAIALAAHTCSAPLPCESSTKNGAGTAFVNGGGSVSVTSVVDATCTASATIPSATCPIPAPAVVSATKICNDNVACGDASASFAVTICNDGDVAWSGTWSDANCGIANQAIALAAHTCSAPLPCESSTKNGAGTAFVNGGGSVSVTSDLNATCTASATIPSAQCPITPCPCKVMIDKTVAPDVDCNGVADSAFVDDVTVDAGVCVVYKICVTNTGQQVLDAAGVKVSDAHLGVANFDFGLIAIGATVCKFVASDIPAVQCPNNLCVCTDVQGTNTAVISAAICDITKVNACEQAGSDCSDTANVACTTPMACRMTGGQNYFAGSPTDTTLPSGLSYTVGGQIGAPTDAGCRAFPQKGKCVNGLCTGGLNGGKACTTNTDCPADAGKGSTTGPWGDWEHNHHSGPDDSGSVTGGSFAFHSGTAAAPDAAFIHSIICADEGWCVQARPAPNKQIYWDGTGVFHNIKGKKGENLPLAVFNACAVQPVPWSDKTGGTIVYYKAHVGDFGEPAGTKQNPASNCSWVDGTAELGDMGTADNCQLVGTVDLLNGTKDEKFTALHPLCLAQDCKETTGGGCPDWYEIEIHCTADPASPIAYTVAHFITDGNFQLHPSVGSSCQPCGDGICQPEFDETCLSCPADCGTCPL